MDENAMIRPGKGKARKIILGIAIGLVLVLCSAYVGLCAYVSRLDTVLPGIFAGDIALGGMTLEQAEQAVEQRAVSEYAGVTYTLKSGDTSVVIDGSLMENDGRAVAQRAYQIGRSEMFLKRGAVILAQLRGNEYRFAYEIKIKPESVDAVDQAIEQLAAAEHVALVETIWAIEDDVLTIKRGVNGVEVDREFARRAVLEAYPSKNSQTFEVPLIVTKMEDLDIRPIYESVFVAPQDAYVRREDLAVMPHVVGVSFDLGQAQVQFDGLPEGGMMSVEFTKTVPELTQERLQELLFVDVLSECVTDIGGTENRLNNVIVAAKAMDGVVLLPGDVFSYNDTLGPRTKARGYLPAPAYIGGKTVDDVGGGICQNSSTLYMAVLQANLEIVKRVNHMYTVGYVPDGLDATVAYNAIDFQFRNNTPYPIRLEARVEERNMIVVLHGTKENENYVVMETETLSTTPYEVVYKEDETVAVGKTVVETTPYTGCKVRAYRCVYDGQGNLISRTQESVSNYRRRDKVILFNPADAERLGLVKMADGTIVLVVPPENTGAEEPVSPEETPPVQEDSATTVEPMEGQAGMQ